MKKIVYILAAALALTACFQEEIHHPSEAKAPETASIYEPIITVDQEINQVTFSIDAKDVIPVWLFYNAKTDDFTDRYAENGLKKIFASAGDYKVRMQVMNAAGVSPDYVEKTFHINNTIMSFDKYVTFLAGGTGDGMSKVWHIDGEVAAHMGCGEPGTDGTNWWSAAVGDKAAFGVYEDLLTFGSNYSYVYNPGEDGATYVNIDGVTVSPFVDQKAGATADYNVTVAEQTATYKFEVEGDDVFLVLPEHTLFPYIPNDAFWAEPKMKILSINRETVELVHDNGAIAWHFILTSKAGKVVFKGFNYNADSNLWKPADAEGGLEISYYYAPGWAQIADPTLTKDGNEYSWNLPSATSDRWQAQVFMVPTTPIVTTADKHYDFSCILNTTKDLTAKVKLHKVGDDGAILVDADVPVKAGEEVVFYLTDIEGIDAENVRLVLDFGGCQDGTDVSVGRIVLKDHAIDDGTVLPGDDNPEDPNQGGTTYTYGENLLGGLALDSTWFSAADWSGGLNPNAAYEGGKLTLTVPDGVGGAEWQGQVKLVAPIPADPEKKYAFFANIESGADGVCTIKVADANDDSNHAFFYDNNVALKGFDTVSYKNEPISPDQAYEAVMVIFDFGRIPAGTEITVTGIELKEITGESAGGQGGYTYGDELLGGLNLDSTWFSPGDWSGGLDPGANYAGGKLTLTVPDGVGGSEWQGQVKLVANVPADPEKKYSFACKVESSADGVCTIKVADANDDSNHAFFYDNNVALKAYDVVSYKNEPVSPDQAYEAVMVIFDFGRIPAGTEITVTGLSLREITGESSGGQQGGGNYGDSILGGLALDSTWFSPGDWSGGLDPGANYAGGKLTLTVPAGVGGSEWQGQVKLVAPVAADPAIAYEFTCKIESSSDGVCTVKVADANDDSNHAFFYDNNVALVAYDVVSYKKEPVSPDQAYEAVMVIFDFGRIPAGTEITVTDITLRPQK